MKKVESHEKEKIELNQKNELLSKQAIELDKKFELEKQKIDCLKEENEEKKRCLKGAENEIILLRNLNSENEIKLAQLKEYLQKKQKEAENKKLCFFSPRNNKNSYKIKEFLESFDLIFDEFEYDQQEYHLEKVLNTFERKKYRSDFCIFIE